MLGSTKNIVRKKLELYEGRVPHFYLDSKSNVTIGVGHLVPTLSKAQELPLRTRKGRQASPQEIEADWDAVRAMSANLLASSYRRATVLILPERDIDQLLDEHISNFHWELRKIYPGFNAYPQEAQMALFDLIFGLGMPALRHQWPRLRLAVLAQDWKEAARESRRGWPISDERNEYVRDLFEQAAAQQAADQNKNKPDP